MAGRAQFSNTVEVAGGAVIGVNSLYGVLTLLAATATEIKKGAAALVARTGVTINSHPDNADSIYVGLDNTVSDTNWVFCLQGGNAISIDLDSDNEVPIYLYSPTAGVRAGFAEVKK